MQESTRSSDPFSNFQTRVSSNCIRCNPPYDTLLECCQLQQMTAASDFMGVECPVKPAPPKVLTNVGQNTSSMLFVGGVCQRCLKVRSCRANPDLFNLDLDFAFLRYVHCWHSVIILYYSYSISCPPFHLRDIQMQYDSQLSL